MAVGRSVDLRVFAEDETGHKYEWRCEAREDTQLHRVAAEWASAHGCDPEAVGLEDEVGVELDLQATPRMLGWLDKDMIRITAFPQLEEQREQIEEELAPRRLEFLAASAESTPQDDSTLPGKSESTTQETAGDEEADKEEEEEASLADESMQGEGEEGSAAPSGLEAEASEQPSEEAAPAEDAKEEEAAPRSSKPLPSPARAKLAAAAPKTGKDAKAKAKAQAAKAKAKSKAKAKTVPETKKQPEKQPKAKPNQQAAKETVPSGSDKIKYASNPKKQGSAAYARYEKYKKAKTVEQALNLGAFKGDIAYDFDKGHLKRV